MLLKVAEQANPSMKTSVVQMGHRDVVQMGHRDVIQMELRHVVQMGHWNVGTLSKAIQLFRDIWHVCVQLLLQM